MVDILNLYTIISHQIFSYLVGVLHTSGFDHINSTIALAVILKEAKIDPSIHKRRYTLSIYAFEILMPYQTSAYCSDILELQVIYKPRERELDIGLIAYIDHV